MTNFNSKHSTTTIPTPTPIPLNMKCGDCTPLVNNAWTCDWCDASLDRWGNCIRNC